MPSTRFSLQRFFGVLTILAIGFFGGLAYANRTPSPAGKTATPTLGLSQTLNTAWTTIHRDYVNRNVNDTELIRGAIGGMVNALGDPYSTYFDPAEATSFQAEIDGTFEGIGMELGMKDKQLTVIAPLSGSPAEKAGLKSGDRIMTIDGQESSDFTVDEAVKKIRGKQGTTVTLTLLRGTATTPLSLTVTRAVIQVPSVTGNVLDGTRLGYIRIASFSGTTNQDFRTQANALLAKSITGLIVDVRNNPGGILQQAVDIASAFIPSGPVVSEIDGTGNKRIEKASGDAYLEKVKTVILVNQGSASASEILAGALQDTKKARVIGATTFGKGSVQTLKDFSDGSSMKLTIAKWYTPNGRSISDQGIFPDEAVEITEANITANVDTQLDRAKEYLQ